jgi:hypothetical protein
MGWSARKPGQTNLFSALRDSTLFSLSFFNQQQQLDSRPLQQQNRLIPHFSVTKYIYKSSYLYACELTSSHFSNSYNYLNAQIFFASFID